MDHHIAAAEHHEEAAKSHRKAALYYTDGDNQNANEAATLARAYGHQAEEHCALAMQ
jgi:hypothetical protein